MKPLAHTLQPKFNLDAERCILSALLTNNDTYHQVSSILAPDDFFEDLHANAYGAISELIQANQPATPITLGSYFGPEPVVDGMSMTQYLGMLQGEVASILSVRGYAEQIKRLSVARAAVFRSCQFVDNVQDLRPGADLSAAIREAADDLYELQKELEKERAAASLYDDYVDDLSRAFRERSVSGVPIGLPEIATVLSESSFEAGNLYGLLSSSGEGKTSLVMQLIAHAVETGHPVIFLSWDQSPVQCVRQLVAQKFGIEARRQRAGDISETEFGTGMDYARWLSDQPFEIKRCGRITVKTVGAYVRQFLKRHANGKPPLVVVDHVRKLAFADGRNTHEGRIAADVNQACKEFAVEFGAAWLNLNQRNSGGSRRDNPRPVDLDMFGGESAKEDYDAVFYLYRYLKWLAQREATAATESDWKKIHRVFPPKVVNDRIDIAEIGAIKVRSADQFIRKRVEFEARFTRYISREREQDELQPEMFGA